MVSFGSWSFSCPVSGSSRESLKPWDITKHRTCDPEKCGIETGIWSMKTEKQTLETKDDCKYPHLLLNTLYSCVLLWKLLLFVSQKTELLYPDIYTNTHLKIIINLDISSMLNLLNCFVFIHIKTVTCPRVSQHDYLKQWFPVVGLWPLKIKYMSRVIFLLGHKNLKHIVLQIVWWLLKFFLGPLEDSRHPGWEPLALKLFCKRFLPSQKN